MFQATTLAENLYLTVPPLLTFETYLSAMDAAAASSAPWRTESRTMAVLKTSSGHSTVDWKRRVSSSLPFSVGPVPMYFEAGLSGEVTAQLNVIFNEAAKNFTPNGQISGKVTKYLE